MIVSPANVCAKEFCVPFAYHYFIDFRVLRPCGACGRGAFGAAAPSYFFFIIIISYRFLRCVPGFRRGVIRVSWVSLHGKTCMSPAPKYIISVLNRVKLTEKQGDLRGFANCGGRAACGGSISFHFFILFILLSNFLCYFQISYFSTIQSFALDGARFFPAKRLGGESERRVEQ